MANEAAPIVAVYFEKQMLRKLGYKFDPADLETWEVDAYGIIACEIEKYKDKQMRKK